MLFSSNAQIIFAAIVATALVSNTYAAENSASCHAILDNNERLLCYDKINKSPVDTSTNYEDKSASQTSILIERANKEAVLNYNRFAITPHKPNYLLPLTYNNNPNTGIYNELTPGDKFSRNLDKYELKFQLSFKLPIVREFFGRDSSLWFAYSQVAFWQMYNFDESAPFRETTYEPELIWVNKTDFKLFDFKNTFITLALNHQSNGNSEPLSRSWNRLVASFILERNNIILAFKPWYRFPESDDNNPDIDEYLGYADFYALFKYKEHLSTIMFRNNLKSENKTTVELTYTFGISNRFKGIAQYFNGYGESLIDYNHRAQRFGVGILITDWL